jgi:2,5-furandicarboxylate decarboxylase 1
VLANHRSGGDLLGDLPITVQHELDAGRYLTSAVLVVTDPRTGATNLSINRLQVTGRNELRALMLAGRLREVFAHQEETGADLPVALCLGVDPLVALASQAPALPGLDDLGVASALHCSALEVTRLPGLAAPVPARTEMVLLGHFRAGERGQEGPFGEFPRTYGPAAPAPVLELTDRWWRDDAVVQTILSGGREHFWLGGLPREAQILEALERVGVEPAGVRLTEAGSCRLEAVVALREARPGTVNDVAMATFAAVGTVKTVIVVNDDVDIFDDEQVGWAVSTRVQADRDLTVVPNVRGSSLDPSAPDGVTAKLAIDATVDLAAEPRYAKMRIQPRDPVRVAGYLDALERIDAGP